MTAAAFINADILRRLADDTRPVPAGDAFAAEFGRDPSNFRKTLKLLEGDGLVVRPAGQPAAITDLGRQTLRGIDVAEGREPAPDAPAHIPTRWPVAMIRRNPANREISIASVLEMVDAIIGFGDIIQPLTLTPPDANGVRMILAGERRWRAVAMLSGALGEGARAAAGMRELPAPLAEGLPFVEREATDAEALLITVVENTAREDLTPLDDAYLLLKLAEATGWSGAEVARRTGRQSETKKNGAKDVQDKLKIAREATPEAITEYRRTGSWDDLRNSVRDRREPEADADQLPMFEEEGEAPLCTFIAGQPYVQRFDHRNPTQTVGDVAPHLGLEAGGYLPIEDASEADTFETLMLPLSRPSRYGPTSYPQAQIQIAKIRGVEAWVEASGYSLSDIGNHVRLTGVGRTTPVHPDRRTALMAGIDSIAEGITRNKNGKMPVAIADWLQSPTAAGPHVVGFVDYLNASRAQEARYAQGFDKRPQPNSGGGLKPEVQEASAEAELSPRARLALVELAIKIKRAPTPTDGEHDPGRALNGSDLPGAWSRYGAPIGAYWTDPTFAELAKAGLVRAVHRKGGAQALATLTDKGVTHMGHDLPHPTATYCVALQAATGSAAAPEGRTYITEWLEREAAPPAQVADAAPDPEPDDTDEYDRTPEQAEADVALLGQVLTFCHADAEELDEEGARALMRQLGMTGFSEDAHGALFATRNGDALPLAYFDCEGHLPPEQTRAAALLVAWACRAVFGGEAQ